MKLKAPVLTTLQHEPVCKFCSYCRRPKKVKNFRYDHHTRQFESICIRCEADLTEVRACSKCQSRYVVNIGFYREPTNKNGRRSRCKTCLRQDSQEYKNRKRERAAAVKRDQRTRKASRLDKYKDLLFFDFRIHHTLRKCSRPCPRPDSCPFCDGHKLCLKCGLKDLELTPECPGAFVTESMLTMYILGALTYTYEGWIIG